MLTEKTFDTGTVTINYAEGPPSGLPLVLLHGASLHWQNYLPVLPLLSFRYHTYAFDLRGHGLSGHVPGAYRQIDYAQDVVRFLRENADASAVLVGHSLGAMVAVQTAVDAPELVRALVLEEPAPPVFSRTWKRDSIDEEHPFGAINLFFRSIRDLLKTESSMDEIISFLAEANPEGGAIENRAWAKSLSQLDPDVIDHLLDHRVAKDWNPQESLPRIACPVLLIQGNTALGGQVEAQHVEWAMSLLDQGIHLYLEDVGHSVHTPQPMTFIRIVTKFLESL